MQHAALSAELHSVGDSIVCPALKTGYVELCELYPEEKDDVDSREKPRGHSVGSKETLAISAWRPSCQTSDTVRGSVIVYALVDDGSLSATSIRSIVEQHSRWIWCGQVC
jgi:hypothetical protein